MTDIERKVDEITHNSTWGFQVWRKKREEVVNEFDNKEARDWLFQVGVEPKSPYEQVMAFHALGYFIMWLDRKGKCYYEIDGDERWFRDCYSSVYGDLVVWESDGGKQRGIIKKTDLKENEQ